MDKKQKIMEAAVNLFNRTHDVKKVSIEDIAAEAGVSPTTIYNNFGDRETLVYEVVKSFVRDVLDRSRAFLESDLSFPEKLIAITASKTEMTEKVNSEILQKLISWDKKIAPFVDKLFEEEIKPLWKKLVEDGKNQGYIDLSLDDDVLITYIDIIRAGIRGRPELLPDFRENMPFIEKLSRLMFYGFLKKEIDLFRKEEKQAHD